jgi:glycosyltransferase involved in cell wall biosynthesis
MRLGIVLHDFALGGTERIAVRLAEAWARAGAEVEIFCGSEAGPIRSLVARSVRVVEADPPIPRRIGSRKRLGVAAASYFRDRRFDGIFIPGNFHWPLIAPLGKIVQNRRPRLVAQISSALRKAGRRGFRQHFFEARSRRRLAGADAIVALSEQAASQARAMFGKPVHVIRLPVLPDESPTLVMVPGGDPLVVAAGRFVEQKDFTTLVEAFALVRHSNVSLAIVGDGPQRNRVTQRIRELGLGRRVTLPGYVDDIRPWLDRARVFALSSRHEGYGAVIVEALAAGRPVVATDCTPAATELLGDGEAGLAVPIADPAALAGALDAMLDRPPPDPIAIARRVEPWKIGPIAEQYLDLFE